MSPRLTDLVAGRVEHADRGTCPRCQKRRAVVYVQARAVINRSGDPDQAKNRTTSHIRTKATISSTKGVTYCRACAKEVIGQMAQLLGTEVRDGEAD